MPRGCGRLSGRPCWRRSNAPLGEKPGRGQLSASRPGGLRTGGLDAPDLSDDGPREPPRCAPPPPPEDSVPAVADESILRRFVPYVRTMRSATPDHAPVYAKLIPPPGRAARGDIALFHERPNP